jgi:mono/diheme cytochrome c family protein
MARVKTKRIADRGREAACSWVLGVLLAACSATAAEIQADRPKGHLGEQQAESPAERGYRLLRTKVYLPPDFDQETFDELWKTWEEPLRSRAEKATPAERRKMAFSRYGLTSEPGDPSGKPQQYVVDDQGNWTMCCLACHQGKVAGRVIPGAPNTLFALETLTDEVRETKLRLHKRLARMEIGSMFMPLGSTNGTTNAVMFGVALMARRDADLNVLPLDLPPKMVHHDHDAPAWWLFHKKQRIYSDGFAAKGHRALMQFMLVSTNGPEKFRQWEADYKDVYAWLESIESPAYPFAIDRSLAAAGRKVFDQHCARCHGTYGAGGSYPNRIVPIDEVGTDRVRLDSLSVQHRTAYARSWFAHYGEEKTIADPGGYLAPPLDGIWASAPYFHNGSVPTLWHVLHPADRPVVWSRSEDGYDREKVGVEATTYASMPASVTGPKARRRYFDTRAFGKSSAGHLFPDELDEGQKRAVLEYLKTL